jgi:hypothetical protein
LRVTIAEYLRLILRETREKISLESIALLALLETRPGKEAELEVFLKSAQPLVEQETGTRNWYTVKIRQTKFGIFDTFANEERRNAHLSGNVSSDQKSSPLGILQPKLPV